MAEANVVQEIEVCASCMAACPVQTDTRGYAEAISQGNYELALELLLESNPFPSVCGRICHHPCEQACRRATVDTPVGLRALKRFVVEQTSEYRKSRKPEVKPANGKKVAIIGSGPAGLTAANDLALEGFAVDVFEAADTPGGMLGQTIPRYRLPIDVLMEDIDAVLALGVNLSTGVEIGKDKMMSELRDEYDAVLVATGLSESSGLVVDGIEAPGVHLAMDFLKVAAAGGPVTLGEKVVVIGGGNVAFDVARTARRLGAKSITLTCLESRDEMPAWEWEVEEGVDEGVELMPGYGPKLIFVEDDVVKGIELKRCTSVFDDAGRFSPTFDEDNVAIKVCTSVILAIGQRADLGCLEGSDIEVDDRGRLVYSITSLSTSQEGVFAAGEVGTGPGAAIEAVREGHRAAVAIAHYIDTGTLMELPPPDIAKPDELTEAVAHRVNESGRFDPAMVDAEERVQDFREVETGLTEAEALAESRRCLACLTGAEVNETVCAGCLTCVRICPYDIPTVDRTAAVNAAQCQACGLCATECPAGAITLARFSTDEMREKIAELKEAAGDDLKHPLVLSYCCVFETTSRKYLMPKIEEAVETGILRILVPCSARLSLNDLLAPLELGVDGVVVLSCDEGECVTPAAEAKLDRHVRQARQTLEDAGVPADRILHFRTKGSAEESWEGFWAEALETLSDLKTAAGSEVTE